MTKQDVLSFLKQHRYAVQASIAGSGGPQAAVVGIVVTDSLELVFDTLQTSRKCENLRRNPKIAFVIGWDEITVQYEGIADEPRGEELARLQELYFEGFPDGRERALSPDITYFRAKPTWLRYSDFRPTPWLIEESSAEALLG